MLNDNSIISFNQVQINVNILLMYIVITNRDLKMSIRVGRHDIHGIEYRSGRGKFTA
jgi:hypothetical protein